MDKTLMTDSQTDRGESLLRQCLIAAVPLWVERVLGYSEEKRKERQKACAEVVAYRGDVLLFGGKPGQAADAFNHLAEGVAILSILAKGGVPIFGLVFDTNPKTGTLKIRRDPGYDAIQKRKKEEACRRKRSARNARRKCE